MPLGIERINARHRSPNDRIAFIKPLEGPDKTFAQDFLERIAAICYPIMKANHLAVMSLEEYEPNREFVGRNFNAGEVIQLVLKAPYTGHWLPFRHVQMVMMHELAHCKQMNHSKAFWKVRNQYCHELRSLWERNYTGDGFWSRGQTLLSGQYTASSLGANDVLPHSLCGGTYRTQQRKRKRRHESSATPSLSYAERQQRRIAKKFGTQGSTLGEDQGVRAILEDGKKITGKPRVAGSARGRELRAAAALQRLEGQKPNDEDEEKYVNSQSDSEADSDYGEPEIKAEAVNKDGKKMLDIKGRGMVQVCKSEEDTEETEDMQRELRELQEVVEDNGSEEKEARKNMGSRQLTVDRDDMSATNRAEDASRRTGASGENGKGAEIIVRGSFLDHASAANSRTTTKIAQKTSQQSSEQQKNLEKPQPEKHPGDCPVCSMANEAGSLTCIVCMNVLQLDKFEDYWRCQSVTCLGGKYVNAGDCGICGVCGARRLPSFA